MAALRPQVDVLEYPTKGSSWVRVRFIDRRAFCRLKRLGVWVTPCYTERCGGENRRQRLHQKPRPRRGADFGWPRKPIKPI